MFVLEFGYTTLHPETFPYTPKNGEITEGLFRFTLFQTDTTFITLL